ncbi:MAG: cytochrome c [Bacteroidota bacterium]
MIWAVLVLATSFSAGVHAGSGDPEPIEKLYARTCGSCHGPEGTGIPGTYPSLLASRSVSSDSAGTLVRIVLHGLQGPLVNDGMYYESVMPAFKGLSDQEIADLVTYVRASFGQAAGIDSSYVARVREATSSRLYPWDTAELMLYE